MVWVLILAFGTLYSIYSVVRHLRFETYIFDLGYYDQLLWLAAHGKKIFSSVIEAHPWVDHFSPSIFLLTPLYWLWSDPRVLLIFQAGFIALGAYPIYKLSLRKTNSYIFSISLSLCYLTFYGLQNAIAYDFHAVVLGPTLLAFLFWFYEEKKFRLFWPTLIIFVGLQENFFILASAIGLFLIVKYKDFKRGLPIFLGGLILAGVLLFYLIPYVFGSRYYYVPAHLRQINLTQIIHALYTPTSKIDVVVFAFIAFGLLPIFSPHFLIILGEEFLGRFLGTTNPNWWILGFHYNAILAPILAFASITTFDKYFRRKEILAVVLLFGGMIISHIRVKPDISKMFYTSYYDLSATSDAKKVLAYLPKEASVAASNNLGAQIAGREGLIFLTNCVENTEVWGADGRRCYKLKPEYILADMNPDDKRNNNFYPDYDRESIWRYLTYVQEKGKYTLVKNVGFVYLLKRND